MRVIGICGQPSAGKDMAAEYLVTRGFVHISNGDRIREDMKREGLPLDRSSMREYAAAKRRLVGPAYPATEICPLVTGDTVLTGFRNTAEVKYAQEFFGNDFFLLSLEAPFDIRYERARARNRAGDNITIEAFREQEEAERSNNSDAHEVDRVIAMANAHIMNAGTAADLFAALDRMLETV